MRLLKTATSPDGRLEMVDFQGPDPQPYAILSHTWGEEEVLYSDLKRSGAVVQKKGYRKIKLTLAQARQDGLAYAWVDTWCVLLL